MSVMQRLKEVAGNGEGFTAPSFNAADSQEMAGMEEVMQTIPIPGQSLTQDPEQQLPFETPPEFTDTQEFIDNVFLELSDPEKLPQLLEFMRDGVPLELLAEKYLTRKFRDGVINPDLLLLSIEPTIYILISLATYAKIDPVLYPEDEMEEDDESMNMQARAYRMASSELENDLEEQGSIENVQAPAVAPRGLLSRSEQAVKEVV